jgi:hypothetical protein
MGWSRAPGLLRRLSRLAGGRGLYRAALRGEAGDSTDGVESFIDVLVHSVTGAAYVPATVDVQEIDQATEKQALATATQGAERATGARAQVAAPGQRLACRRAPADRRVLVVPSANSPPNALACGTDPRGLSVG